MSPTPTHVVRKTHCTPFIFEDSRDAAISYHNISNTSMCKPCFMTISVEEVPYHTGKVVYNIQYKYYKINGWKHQTDKYSHPFFNPETNSMHDCILDGEIIAKNPVTTGLVDMLLMSFEDMEPLIGTSRPTDYKKQLMQIVSRLYD